MLFGNAERISDAFGKPIRDLTDIEILFLLASRRYIKEQNEARAKDQQEQSSEVMRPTSPTALTFNELLTYNGLT